MSRSSLDRLHDRLLDVQDEVDDRHLPARFKEARSMLIGALTMMEKSGIPNDTIVTVMLSEMLPRMVHQNGPVWTAAMLARLAQNVGSGASPAGAMQ